MKNIFAKGILSAFTTVAVAMSSFALITLPVMAFDAPAPDSGAVGEISNAGEWSIYNSKVGYTRSSTQGTKITDKTNDNVGTVEITGSATIGAAFQFDLSTKNNNKSTDDNKVIKSAKLRFTPMVSKSNAKHTVYTINNTFDTTEGKIPIAEFAVPRTTKDDFFSDSDVMALTSDGITQYPEALSKWQTAVDITGDVIIADNTISLLVEHSGGNNQKTEYATSNVANNKRLSGNKVPLLYNNGLTAYSKWVYPQIVFEYSNEENYKCAYADFVWANKKLSTGTVSESVGIDLSTPEKGSTIMLEMYGSDVQPIKIDGNSVMLNNEYAGTAECAYVKLIVSNSGAQYSRVVPVSAEYVPSNTISFDTSKNPQGEISVLSNGNTYTDGIAYAKPGRTFAVNDGANTGYRADVTVTNDDADNPQIITKNADGTYTMPNSNVNVSVSYSKKKTYGTSRIAAINSISIKSDGNKQGHIANASNIVIGAGRITFIKFDLSNYNPDAISEAQIGFTAWNTSNAKAVFYVPNNDWNENNIDANFRIDGTESTSLSNFAYSDGTISLLNGENIRSLIIPKGDDDASTASNGILKDYYIGSSGTKKTANFNITEGIKEAISESTDNIITLMIYSAGGGNDASSVFAGGLFDRPSLTITESSATLPDSALITEINNVQDLERFAEIVSGGNNYTGKTVTLKKDIDLSGKYNQDSESWITIGTSDSDVGMKAFAGIFDGENHTISGLYINEKNPVQGLFGAVTGTVQNLSVEGEVNGSSIVGSIAAWSSGKIVNCHSNVIIKAEREAGGIVGTLSNGGNISNCSNSGSIEVKDKETYAGGIAGNNNGGEIFNCSNSGNIMNGVNGFRNKLGGIVGYLDSGEVSNSYNTGSVRSETEYSTYVADETQNYTGGITGYSDHGIITNCHNKGEVYNAVDYAGGIAGYLHSQDQVSKCYNEGNVYGKSYVGGIVGNNDSEVLNCYNKGAIIGTGNYIGGIVGYLSTGNITSCYGIGDVTGNNNIGGIVGYQAVGSVSNSYYLYGTAAGGIGGVDIINCADSKTVTEFTSGEIAHLLQGKQDGQIWGQAVIGERLDMYPIFTSDNEKKIYKVTFSVTDSENMGEYKEYATAYTNPNGTVTLPPPPANTEKFEFLKWSHTNNSDGAEFNESTAVTSDITIYAVGEIKNSVASVTMIDYNCGEADKVNPIPVSVTNGTNNVTYSYKAKGADDNTYTSEKPNIAGEYVVRAVFAATSNYEKVIATDEFVVSHEYSLQWSKDEKNHWHKCVCGSIQSDSTAVHKWNAGEITKPATCTETGIETFTCTVCGQNKNTTIKATDHNYDGSKWKITTEPTEETQGEAQRVCKNNDTHIEKVTLPVLTDTTVWTKGTTTEPTDATDGSQEYVSVYGTVTVVLNKPISYNVKYVDGNAVVTASKTGIYAIIFAAYDIDGVLLSVEVKNIIVETIGEQPPIVPETFSVNNADNVKVMLWDSLINMKPLGMSDAN